jgi:dienelactone hydrolase
VFLHGYNPPNPQYVRWWSVDQRHNAIAENHDVIWVEPHGRGNAQYLGIGEQDVLRCIQEVKRRLHVDDERVYLTGESMGGAGTWIIGSRHPDLFAAIAPVFGGWDNRVTQGSSGSIVSRPDDSVAELFSQEVQSSFVGAEGLLNVPVFINHGDSDRSVNVDFSRHAVRMLQRWGYNVRYQEHPGRGHEDLDAKDDIAEWLLTHRRVSAPLQVRLRSPDLAGAAAYWVQVEAQEIPLQIIDVDAQILQPGLIRLDTRNVQQLTLSVPAARRTDDPRTRVVWNGQMREIRLSPQGRATLVLGQRTADPLSKRPGFEGGLSKLIQTPFAIVVGTSSRDPLMRQRCQEKADAFAHLWSTWQHSTPRVIRDDQITSADERRYSLLLIGGPDANAVTHRIAAQLPLKVAKDGFSVDGRKIPAADAVLQLIYPSPFEPGRYVALAAGTSAAGLYFWNPLLWHSTIGYPTMNWDWAITDGRRVKLAPNAGAERGWVAAGKFNQHWRRDDRWVFLGDAASRDRSPLRHPPAPGFLVPTQVLDEYAGEYEIAPGFNARVVRNGPHLTVHVPQSPPIDILAESTSDFVVADSGLSAVFTRDERNRVDGLVVNTFGQEIRAKRLDSAPR